MLLHRSALAEHSATAAEAFSGLGGLFGKGRWHTRGRLIVYAAEHISLAMAESLVHIQRSNDITPFNRWEIEVPDALIAAKPSLPVGWENDLPFTQALGDAWLAAGTSVGLFVPSAIVSAELNCLLNPAHPRFSLSWVVSGPHLFNFVRRLTKP